MSFIAINSSEINTGEAVKNTTMEKVKDNFDNLDSRITGLEGGSATVYPPIILRVNGYYGESGNLVIPATGVLKTTINFNLTVTGARLIIDQAGISGTTEVDLQYKRGSGIWTSIFNTKPSVGYASGNDFSSTNAILNPDHVNLSAADLIRVNIDSTQVRANGFMIRVDFNKT